MCLPPPLPPSVPPALPPSLPLFLAAHPLSQGCARVAQCMQSSCGRNVSVREASGTYTDCISVCNEAPSTIVPLADMSCYKVTCL